MVRKGWIGKIFYGCEGYLKCWFIFVGKLIEKECFVCYFLLVVLCKGKKGY